MVLILNVDYNESWISFYKLEMDLETSGIKGLDELDY